MKKSEAINFFDGLTPKIKGQLLSHILKEEPELLDTLSAEVSISVVSALLKDSKNILIEEESTGTEYVFKTNEIDKTGLEPVGMVYMAKAEFEEESTPKT